MFAVGVETSQFDFLKLDYHILTTTPVRRAPHFTLSPHSGALDQKVERFLFDGANTVVSWVQGIAQRECGRRLTPLLEKVKALPMTRLDVDDATRTPMRRGPFGFRLRPDREAPLASAMFISEKKVHSM